MSSPRSLTSSVEVVADPATAFMVFTEEIDCWWVQGAINFHDSSRAYGHRIEPGVGGRIMEVYDTSTGEGLELARITVWEPGTRLAWKSSIDDVEIEVRFDKSDKGTLVEVEATLAPDGANRGGTSWVRMTPLWLGEWVRKRDRVSHEPLRLARMSIAIYYAKPAAAARWLQDAFGLEPAAGIPDVDGSLEETWIEFLVGNCSVILFMGADEGVDGAPVTHAPWVFVDDLDAHYANAKAHGATIIQEIWQHGPRAYDAADLEGNHWTFAQAGPRM